MADEPKKIESTKIVAEKKQETIANIPKVLDKLPTARFEEIIKNNSEIKGEWAKLISERK